MGVNPRNAGPIFGGFAVFRATVCRITFCFVVVVGCFGTASAQDLTPLVMQCASDGSPELLTSCQSAVLAAQAIRGGIAVTHTTGAELSGSSSTIGRRGSAPRVSVDVRLRIGRFVMPDLLGGGTGAVGENVVNTYGVSGSVAVGVLGGFSLMPTVGGVLSLDFLASGSLIFLGESDGFPGNEGIFSVGGRFGIFRESFTLPGVTVSVMKSSGGSVELTEGVNASQIDTDISATSVRVTVGKDFFTFAVLAGFGWNWDQGEMRVQVPDPMIPGGQGIGLVDDLTTRRSVYFAGVSITRLVWTLSVEGGWVGGYDGLAGYPGVYDPGAITPFVSVAARLTI